METRTVKINVCDGRTETLTLKTEKGITDGKLNTRAMCFTTLTLTGQEIEVFEIMTDGSSRRLWLNC